jgi:hypothetical protein
MQKLKQTMLSIAIGLTLFNPTVAIAQGTSGAPQYSGVQESITQFLCTPSVPSDGRDLERCVNKLYRFGISFGAIALVFFVVFAGYMYMASGEAGKGKAKGILQNSMVGMGILLFSYVLLRFINPNLVAYKPIQPPIFTAEDIPDCEKVGLGVNCIVATEDSTVVTSSKGGYANCPDGIIAFDKKSVPVNQGADTELVCKALMEKLKLIHAKTKITVTATIGPGHDSKCHKTGFPQSGVCADMAPQNGNWEELCSTIQSVGGLAVLNESGKSSVACGTFVKTPKWSGAHLHVWLRG